MDTRTEHRPCCRHLPSDTTVAGVAQVRTWVIYYLLIPSGGRVSGKLGKCAKDRLFEHLENQQSRKLHFEILALLLVFPAHVDKPLLWIHVNGSAGGL